ncbi:MAG: carbohydrate binding family 9 domain-containing protein [candidate division WOR-3 bacterium]|nr:MAG: carbohydrate binding family 9 domain-containing protein [candidate division WOR-3 bacterium]
MLFLLCTLLAINSKSVEVRFTDNAPRIDGIIEDTWAIADSAYDFIQHEPYEKTDPCDRTVVYVLQDAENLYIAFRCYTDNIKPIAAFTKDEDHLTIGIDPFGSKTSGYYFQVFGSQIKYDGWIHDDGRVHDDSWEGIWYRAVHFFDDRYEAEFKIPFKSIRYKKGLTSWGIQFRRYYAANREEDFWTEVLQSEGDLVSRWGTLENINPQATGYYFELYPEAYVRIDRNWYWDENDSTYIDSIDTKPSMSMNAKWDISPQTSLNATVLPDFAQIESDPFTLNLGRYPTYLQERRPFFLEGQDVFRMSAFGGWGFFQPLEIFYSRRIGKSLNGDAVPILGGLKVTHKTEGLNVGLLGAYTDEYVEDEIVIEPDRWFGTLRAKQRVLDNSDIGMLFSGMRADENDYNYVLGLDAVYRKGAHQFIMQGAASDKNDTRGWAVNSGYFGYIKNFITFASGSIIDSSFDVSDIGFVPWAGMKRLFVMSGPYKQFRSGPIRTFFITPGISVFQEPGDTNWSYHGVGEINAQFRNNWGFDMFLEAGKTHEADTNFLYRSLNLSTWGNLGGNYINTGFYYAYQYNYRRMYPAYSGSHWFVYNYSIIDNVSVGVNANFWLEWDSTNTFASLTSLVRPNMFIRFTADMSLRITTEFVMYTPQTEYDETELVQVRTGALFSWNFLPKSWLYIALNDYHAQDYMTGELEPVYTIGAIKAKYLFYF